MKELTFNEQARKKLKGDIQKNALDFIAFLRANEIQPPNPGVDWYDGPGGAYVCFLSVCPDWKKRIGCWSWSMGLRGVDMHSDIREAALKLGYVDARPVTGHPFDVWNDRPRRTERSMSFD